MKKLVCTVSVLFGILLLSSCGMKQCKCLSYNTITENDSIIRDTVNTVFNDTRGNCEDLNKKEVFQMDSNVYLHHTLICQDN